jgi:predicted dehydrogenase
LTIRGSESLELVNLAEKSGLVLLTGFTFLYNKAINKVKEYMSGGQLGNICYLDASRTNLGPIRKDVNALVDLASHDISIFLYLLNKTPEAVSAQGAYYINKDREDVVYLNLYFAGNIMGHIHVSWLEPRKIRLMTVIGDKKMLVFDDMNSLEPIRIYDKSVITTDKAYKNFEEFPTTIWDGEVVIPKINLSEPLKNQCKYFIELVNCGKSSSSDNELAVNVSKILEASEKSLKEKGKVINL